jgi:hypothetical protein
MSTPYADDVRFTYENVTATCPLCRHQNTYNRVSDLGTTRLIASKHVKCQDQECGQIFGINGDIVSPPYVLLLNEAYWHRREKAYRECITTLATAYELLLRRAVQHTITYEVFTQQRLADVPDWDAYNNLALSLHNLLQSWHVAGLVSMLTWVLTEPAPRNLETARALIQEMQDRRKRRRDDNLEAISLPLREPLIRLRTSMVQRLRNQIVHRGYRPTAQEAEDALAEARMIIYTLYYRLDLQRSEPDRI